MTTSDTAVLLSISPGKASPVGAVVAQEGDLAEENRFGFSTKYCDEETGLLYYGYRYLDPDLGRWLSRDPIGELVHGNLYDWVINDPINVLDLLGLKDTVVKSDDSQIGGYESIWNDLPVRDPDQTIQGTTTPFVYHDCRCDCSSDGTFWSWICNSIRLRIIMAIRSGEWYEARYPGRSDIEMEATRIHEQVHADAILAAWEAWNKSGIRGQLDEVAKIKNSSDFCEEGRKWLNNNVINPITEALHKASKDAEQLAHDTANDYRYPDAQDN